MIMVYSEATTEDLRATEKLTVTAVDSEVTTEKEELRATD